MATGEDEAAVEAAMAATGDHMKASIVMLLAGVSAEEAFRRLKEADGKVRGALQA
jgi:N-acetylmuramic acid 6-phosphate etherase